MKTRMLGYGYAVFIGLAAACSPVFGQDEEASESPLVKLLKRLPDERKPAIIERIGKGGKPAELTFLFTQAVTPEGFSSATKRKALEALAEASLTRKLQPEGDLTPLGTLLVPTYDQSLRIAAIRLTALWKVERLSKPLREIADTNTASEALRGAALDALSTLGGDANKAAIAALAKPDQPVSLRALAVSALAKSDAKAAAELAAAVLKDAAPGQGFTRMIEPFLDRKGATEALTTAITQANIPPDSARLALRALYALGRSDANLVSILSKLANITTEIKPLDKNAMDALINEVAAKGSAARGEQVFRRADLNCTKCHALVGAGGGVGPDLSAVGSTSPVDYLINSIMLPDQAIKEEFITKVIQTTDGRVYQGIVADKDDKRIVLREATGELRTIPTDDIDESKDGGSLMPKGLVNFLTRAEFVDLLRFLSELGKPGAYAIHTTPTIQRWRLLKPLSEDLAKAVPDDDLFQKDVLGAETSRWLTGYALVTGNVPLGEFAGLSESSVLYIQGEVNVTAAGAVEFRLGDSAGIKAWIDDKSAPDGATVRVELEPGVHRLTLRVNTTARTTLRVEVAKPEGSAAEFTVVGGR